MLCKSIVSKLFFDPNTCQSKIQISSHESLSLLESDTLIDSAKNIVMKNVHDVYLIARMRSFMRKHWSVYSSLLDRGLVSSNAHAR